MPPSPSPPSPSAHSSPTAQAPGYSASGSNGYLPAGCTPSLSPYPYTQPQLSSPFAPLWAPTDKLSSLAPCYAAEVHAVDMLALQREFSVVPTVTSVPAVQPRDVATAAVSGGRPAVSAAMELHGLAAVESALPWLPTMTELGGCQLTLSPVIWRDIAPPYRIQVPPPPPALASRRFATYCRRCHVSAVQILIVGHPSDVRVHLPRSHFDCAIKAAT